MLRFPRFLLYAPKNREFMFVVKVKELNQTRLGVTGNVSKTVDVFYPLHSLHNRAPSVSDFNKMLRGFLYFF